MNILSVKKTLDPSRIITKAFSDTDVSFLLTGTNCSPGQSLFAAN